MPSILSAAASGMIHHQAVIDVVGNNVANVNTFGFKRVRALNQGAPEPAVPFRGNRLGVAETTTDINFARGTLQRTDNPLHFAIADDAFFAVRDANGAIVYTRLGALDVDPNGNIVAVGGRLLEPPVTLPPGYRDPVIGPLGHVTAVNEMGERVVVGTISVFRFANPQGLESLGDGLYRETANSGARTQGTPGDGNFASLLTGFLEGSNVDVSEELTTMLIAQRAYQAALKSFQVGDDMLALATNLTR